jgi:hypothetical protein
LATSNRICTISFTNSELAEVGYIPIDICTKGKSQRIYSGI